MKGKIFNAQEVQSIIAGDTTLLTLYRIVYESCTSSVKESIFYFKNNQKFDDYLFLKEGYSPELFLEKNNPSSRYYEKAYKVNEVPVRYSRNSYNPRDLKGYSAIVIDKQGNMQPLKYNYTAKGFGYTGYISDDNETFYFNKEQAETVSSEFIKRRINKEIDSLLENYPEAEKILKEKYGK